MRGVLKKRPVADLCFASFRLKIGEESLGNLHNYTWDNYISQITKGIALIKIQGPLCTLTIKLQKVPQKTYLADALKCLIIDYHQSPNHHHHHQLGKGSEKNVISLVFYQILPNFKRS